MNSCTRVVATLALGLVLASPALRAQSSNSNTVTVAYTTNSVTALNQGFAGFTTEILGGGIEFIDTNMQNVAAQLSPGWLLYPGGETADAFDWSAGLTISNWVVTIGERQGSNANTSNLCQGTYLSLLGKTGMQFTDFATMCENLGGAKIIVCINGFTDSNTAAGNLAAFAKSNHIQVAAYELCNEPYLFANGTNSFFTNGTDYANLMQPYAAAIKAVDSNAVISVFFSDPSRSGMSWDNALSNYSNPYWNSVVYHYYPQMPGGATFAQLMALDNGCLVSNSTLYVSNVMIPRSPTNATFMLTEFAPAEGNNDGTPAYPTTTLYGGIYAAEYIMRLSTIPRMAYAGSYQLVNGSGVFYTNKQYYPVTNAAANGYVTNTVGKPFGYYLTAQGAGEAVAYWAMNRSTGVYPTTVSTNGPTVYTDTNSIGTMPAIYAQAYQGGNGKRYVLLTNKGSNAVNVQVTENSFPLTNEFLETFVAGNDPTVVNTNPAAANNIYIQTNTVFNPVSIPGYSVVRLERNIFSVTNPVLSGTISNALPTLSWTGLTNVVYNVLAATNLESPWTTIGRVSSLQTNFQFTDPDGDPQRFYQLTVP